MMKLYVKHVFFVMMLLCVATLWTSCGSDDDDDSDDTTTENLYPNANDVVGTWYYSDDNISYTYTFYANNTGTVSYSTPGVSGVQGSGTFTWRWVNATVLTFEGTCNWRSNDGSQKGQNPTSGEFTFSGGKLRQGVRVYSRK